MEDRQPKKKVNTLGKQIRRSASNIFQKWRKEPKTSGASNVVQGASNDHGTGDEVSGGGVSQDQGASNAVQGVDPGAGGEISNSSNQVLYDQGASASAVYKASKNLGAVGREASDSGKVIPHDKGDAMNISEDQKRWLVIGITLINKLVPRIRPFVEQSLQAEYQSLKSSHNIHIQTPPGILKNHTNHLKYENINSNSSHKLSPVNFDSSKFDYKVTSHVDFAKLYLQPFMAKFNAFDGKCDGSAVLSLLGKVPVFSNATQSSAKTVKEDVRNEWAHCNFTDWDAVKFQGCFQEMQKLVQSLGLPAADESILLSELNYWETKGTAFCGNCPVDRALLSLVHSEVLHLSSSLEDFVCQFKEQNDLLKSQVLEAKQNLEELLELPQKLKEMENDVETLTRQTADFSCSAMRRQQSVNSPAFFGALERNEYFTGRKKELESLDNVFQDVNTTWDGLGGCKKNTKVYGICGLGGCGKSSLAFEYAWRNLERYPGGLFVVNGESDNFLRASFQGIFEQFVHKTQPKKHEEEKQFGQLMTETLSWLGSLKEKWLLVVDNMDQKELSPCTRKLFFGQWKNKTSGDILVTSRRSPQALREDLGLRPVNSLELDVFSIDESAEFLKKRSGSPSSDEDQDAGMKELAQELGGLPLALEQAAAYISVLKCSIKLYLEQYREQKSILLNRKSAKPCSEIYNQERLAVQTTWHVNFSYIENDEKDERLGKAAAFFMKIATCLFPNEIPIEILNVGAPEIDHEYLKNRLKMPIGAHQIIDLLRRFSLFKRISDDTLSVHRLVQATLKERCYDEGEIQEVFSSAIRMLHHAFLDCLGGSDYLHDLHVRLDSLKDVQRRPKDVILQSLLSVDTAKLEGRRWRKLVFNAYHLLHLLKTLSFKAEYLFREESARLFCEAAFFWYLLGIESEGYHLQQSVLDILCTVKEPIRFYNGNELMKVTRMLTPWFDSLSVFKKLLSSAKETLQMDIGGLDTNHTNELLRGIELIEPKTREAFARGDFRTAFDLYTQIIKLSVEVNQPNVRPLGEIFCHRGIANLQMENFEEAIDDFNASIDADTEHYRAYYWKVYALCKLVESGRIDFTSRAQAAAAVLHFKFAHSKLDDIKKLQKKFQQGSGLLDGINYKFVTNVSQLTELKSELSEKRNSNDPFTVILADGKYDVKKMVILKGCYYFVCLPGSSAMLSCSEGLFLSNGSFLFENVHFEGCLPSESLQPFSSEAAGGTSAEKGKQLSITLGKSYQAETEATTGSERELSALIEANGVESLIMDHCSLERSTRAGVMVNAQHHQQVIVSLRSSNINSCAGPGIVLQGGTADSHISIFDCEIRSNGYGIVITSPASFYMENNWFHFNILGVMVAAGGCNGEILKNELSHSKRYAILIQGSKAAIEENHVINNFGWGIVCCIGSSLTCKKTVFENNYCGGLRILLNGKGNVFVEKCVFLKNLGPDVFPANAEEMCPLELKCKQLLQISQEEIPDIIYLRDFLYLSTISSVSKYAGEFKCPVLRDNSFSAVPDFLSCNPTGGCSECWTELQSDSDWIECPSCHVARYCCKKCFDTAQAVHSFVCNSIREANKCYPLPLPNSAKEAASQEAVFSLVVVTAVTGSFIANYCVLCYPERNVRVVLRNHNLYAFIMIHGSPVQESMMDIKAASMLAKFDPEFHTVTVFWHRIFPVDKVRNGWNWVSKALHAFCHFLCARRRALSGGNWFKDPVTLEGFMAF